MGKLTNLNPPAPIADADIPAAIARDSEVTAAVAAHVAATDPHPVYLTQVEGDGRYRQTTVALTDTDIPAAIARDSEVTAAVAAHVVVADLHTRCKVFNFLTAATDGGISSVPHGLVPSKILGFSVIVEGAAGNGFFMLPNVFSAPGTLSGNKYNAVIQGGSLLVFNFPGDSYALISKPVRAMIWYLP